MVRDDDGLCSHCGAPLYPSERCDCWDRPTPHPPKALPMSPNTTEKNMDLNELADRVEGPAYSLCDDTGYKDYAGFAMDLCDHGKGNGNMQSAAITDIAAERERQISAEGWTPEHDDEHRDDQALARAAACYALAGTGASGPFWITHLQTPQQVWPYRWEWKPKDRRANLVRAGALIAAEIDRLDRAALLAASQ